METRDCAFRTVEFVFGVSTTCTAGERSWEGVRASSVLGECMSLTTPWLMRTNIPCLSFSSVSYPSRIFRLFARDWILVLLGHMAPAEEGVSVGEGLG